MSIILFTNSSYAGAVTDAVQLPANNFRNQSSSIIPAYSGLKVDADGGLYEKTPGGGWSRYATWLLAGTNTTYYVSRTVAEGSLSVDAGAGPLQCNADREYYISSDGPLKITSVVFELSNDVSGAPIVATASYIFSALVYNDTTTTPGRFVTIAQD